MTNANAAAKVETVNLSARNGRHIRKATRVTIDGRTVTFMELMSKRQAIAQAKDMLARG